MLTELRIENFAIIDHLEIRFSPGLITFTGETGAGKSIILDAVETLLGGRADSTQIRSETDRAIIEATFQISKSNGDSIRRILQQEDLLDNPDYVIFGREIRLNNRNIARINGRSVSVNLMKDIGEFLVDIHGQSEHLSLLHISNHIDLLDRYAGIENQLSAYKETYKNVIKIKKELENLHQNEMNSTRRIDLLTYQINEIKSANLEFGEDKELKEEHKRLANAETLTSILRDTLQLLDDSSPDNPTIIELMGKIVMSMESLSQIDISQIQLEEKSAQIYEDLTDLSNGILNYKETIEFNPNKLIQIEDRLVLINNLKHKYGETIEEILEFLDNANDELEALSDVGQRILELEKQLEHLVLQLTEHGLGLSVLRKSAAESLQNNIEAELADLRMSEARIKVEIKQKEDPGGILLPNGIRVAYDAKGFDAVEFFIETNPGEGFKPLIKIASGGETSRFMLALKNVLAKADKIPTLIFDEIDQGIGGRVGSIVGEKLWLLAKDHQVMCITHLPQLAAYGQQHFKVDKIIESGRTITTVEILDGETRRQELAQMLGELSEGTLKSAQEMIDAVVTTTSTRDN